MVEPEDVVVVPEPDEVDPEVEDAVVVPPAAAAAAASYGEVSAEILPPTHLAAFCAIFAIAF